MITKTKHAVVRALRASERFTKTDMVYATKGGFWLFFGYAFQIATGIVLSVLFANLLPKEAFGTYQFVIAMASVAAVFTLTGIGSALVRAGAQGAEGVLPYGFRLQIRANSGIVLASAAFALYYFIQGNPLLGAAFCIVAISQPFITAFSLYRPFLQGKQLFQRQAITDMVQRIVPFLCMLATLRVTDNPLYLLCAYFISQALTHGAAYVYIARTCDQPLREHPELKTYSKHLSVMESFFEIANVADKVLVWFFLGAVPTALYTLALMPITHLQSVFGFGRILAFPKLAQRPLAELRIVLHEKIRRFFIITCVAVIAYIIAAPYIFSILFPQYLEAVHYSQVLALTVLAIPRTLITQTFIAHQLKRELYIINFTAPTLRIILLAIGLPLFGVWGAVGAVLGTEAVNTIVQWYLFKRIETPAQKAAYE